MRKKSNITWGADPEFFAACVNEDGGLSVIPPVLLRSDYEVPFETNGRHPVFARYGETFIHEDGAAFECSTPPNTDWEVIWNTIHEAKESFSKDILSLYPDVCLPVLYSLPAMNWQVQRWLDRGDEFRLSTIFGCDPDQDVTNMKTRCKVLDASMHPWRYAGGHIHASGIPEIGTRPLDAVKSMMFTAGLAATAYSDVPRLEKERIYLYGKPGKFRIQTYSDGTPGIEYRTPSTRWTDNIDLAKKVFSWGRIGLINLLQGELLYELEPMIYEDVKKVITRVDQNGAKSLLEFISSKI